MENDIKSFIPTGVIILLNIIFVSGIYLLEKWKKDNYLLEDADSLTRNLIFYSVMNWALIGIIFFFFKLLDNFLSNVLTLSLLLFLLLVIVFLVFLKKDSLILLKWWYSFFSWGGRFFLVYLDGGKNNKVIWGIEKKTASSIKLIFLFLCLFIFLGVIYFYDFVSIRHLIAFVFLYVFSLYIYLMKNIEDIVSKENYTFTLNGFESNETFFPKIRIAHISDLHISADSEVTSEGRVFYECNLNNLKDSLVLNSKSYDYLLLTGDVTDFGSDPDWETFTKTFCEFENIIACPGNHDLNNVGKGFVSLFLSIDGEHYSNRLKKLESYLENALHFMPNVKCYYFGREWFLKDSIADVKSKDYCESKNREKFERLNSLFPFFLKDDQKIFFVWNSNKPSMLGLTNSIGYISKNQIDNFKNIISNCEGFDFIHLLHHKVVFPNQEIFWSESLSDLKKRVQLAGMVLENAELFVSEIFKTNELNRNYIFHGHHHTNFSGFLINPSSRSIPVFSAPSSTLGSEAYSCENGFLNGYNIIGVNNGNIKITKNNVDLKGAYGSVGDKFS